MSDSHPYDEISAIALKAWGKVAPNNYAECAQKIKAIIEEYGELGVMAMIAELDRTLVETPAESRDVSAGVSGTASMAGVGEER